MWKHLKNKASRFGGYELSDIRECAATDDNHGKSAVILKRYTKIPSNLHINNCVSDKNYKSFNNKLFKKCDNEPVDTLLSDEDLENNNSQQWSKEQTTTTNSDNLDISNNNIVRHHKAKDATYENINNKLQLNNSHFKKQTKLSPPKMKRRQKVNNTSELSLNVTKDENLESSPLVSQTRKISPKRTSVPNVETHSKDCTAHTPHHLHGSPTKKPLYSKSKKETLLSASARDQNYNPQESVSRSDLSQAILDTEPTHMSWEEVMEEAQLLGISLKTASLMSQSVDSEANKNNSRLKHNKLLSKNTASIFYSDTDECYGRQNPAKETPSMASSASSMGMRNNSVTVSSQTEKYTPQMFKGIAKLQNFFKRAERDDNLPCHCNSKRKYKSKPTSASVKNQPESDRMSIKTDRSSRFSLKEALFSSKFNEKLKKITDRECQECKRQCRICRSLERVSLANKSNVSIPNSLSRFENNESLMARSWQQECTFAEDMEATKSMSLNRRLQHVTRIDSFSSIFTKPLDSRPPQQPSERRPPPPQPPRASSRMEKSGYTPLEVISYHINPSENLKELKNVLWYWGSLNREGASKLLQGKPDGWFLVRNSSEERYALALSFRSGGETHHTGIECINGTFSFHEPSPPVQEEANAAAQPSLVKIQSEKMTAVKFIEQASIKSKSEKDRYYLQPRSSKESIIPVKLWNPVLRPLESLTNLAADVILVSLDGPETLLNLLPVTSSLRRIVRNRLKIKSL